MTTDLESHIFQILQESLTVKSEAIQKNRHTLLKCADLLVASLSSGHKILIFGNGGSAADAQHIAAEFVNRFQVERPPLAALALTTDTSVLSSIGNDYAFDDVFAKQILALGRKGDVAWGISTSGNSKNVLKGMEAAKTMEMATVAMTGSGGALHRLADLCLVAPSLVTARIQEAHSFMAHLVCDLVDRILFPEKFQ